VHADEFVDGALRWTAEENGLDFLWSVVEFINSGSAKTEPIAPFMEKITLSNDWKDGEQSVSIFRVAKVNDQLVIELEVRQNGIVYLLKRK
jgi:hypothetical protein